MIYLQETRKIMQLSQGKLIAFEGIDGSGKSSLVANVSNYFKEITLSHITTKEPGGSELGKYLRNLLHDRPLTITSKAEYLLFAADRAQHFAEVIKPALEQKKLILSDRFADSSLVYQGYARGLDHDTIRLINAWATEGYKPDLTVYIHIDIDTALTRIKKRSEKLTSFEQETRSFYEKLIIGYTELYKNRQDVLTLDGKKTQNDITQETITKILSILS